MRLYERLFAEAHPDAGGKDYLRSLNPNSLKVATTNVVPSVDATQPNQKLQFERFWYFVADWVNHSAQHLVFNKSLVMKDSWGK